MSIITVNIPENLKIEGNIHVHMHNASDRDIRQILETVLFIKQKQLSIMKTLDEVLADVQAEKTLIGSLSTFVQGLSQQLKDALSGENLSPAAQEKVDAIFASVEENKAAVAKVITDNTPAQTEPPVEGGDSGAAPAEPTADPAA